jgi:hypothetical protein
LERLALVQGVAAQIQLASETGRRRQRIREGVVHHVVVHKAQVAVRRHRVHRSMRNLYPTLLGLLCCLFHREAGEGALLLVPHFGLL